MRPSPVARLDPAVAVRPQPAGAGQEVPQNRGMRRRWCASRSPSQPPTEFRILVAWPKNSRDISVTWRLWPQPFAPYRTAVPASIRPVGDASPGPIQAFSPGDAVSMKSPRERGRIRPSACAVVADCPLQDAERPALICPISRDVAQDRGGQSEGWRLSTIEDGLRSGRRKMGEAAAYMLRRISIFWRKTLQAESPLLSRRCRRPSALAIALKGTRPLRFESSEGTASPLDAGRPSKIIEAVS